jgi:hypothetical protein
VVVRDADSSEPGFAPAIAALSGDHAVLYQCLTVDHDASTSG